MTKFILRALIIFICIGCSSEESFNKADFIGKTFDYRFFETFKECQNAQPDPNFFINCHQQLDFISKDKVTIMLTDIVNPASYTVFGNLLIINASERTEFANNIVFEIIDTSTIKNMANGSIWKLRTSESPWE